MTIEVKKTNAETETEDVEYDSDDGMTLVIPRYFEGTVTITVTPLKDVTHSESPFTPFPPHFPR